METKNFFKGKAIIVLTFIFIFLTVINIIYASVVQRGLTFDGTLFFLTKIQYLSQNEQTTFLPGEFRYFISVINALPVTLGYFLFKIESKYILSILWTFPLFLFPALFPWFNYELAKRSKRQDIAVWSLFIYALLIIPTQIWPIVESMLAVSVIFLLFHYICADIKYKISDIIFMIILTGISFSSSEQNMYVGPLLFFLSLFYAKKSSFKISKIFKYITGILCLLMPVGYILHFFFNTRLGYNSVRFFQEIIFYKNFSDFYKEPYLFLFLTILLFFVFMLTGKLKIRKHLVIVLSAMSIFLLYKMFNFHWFYGTDLLQYRVLLYIFPSIIIVIVFLTDFYKEKSNKIVFHNMYVNLLILILFFGSFNNIIQIMTSYTFNEMTNEILSLTKQIGSEENRILINPQKEERIYESKHFKFFKILFDEDYYMSFIPAFSKEYEIKAILYPGDNMSNKFDEKEDKNFNFYKENDFIWLSFFPVSIKNQFWDLSSVAEKAEKEEKLN